jgi:hypothetical protein
MGTVLSNVTCEVTREVTMKNTVFWELQHVMRKKFTTILEDIIAVPVNFY